MKTQFSPKMKEEKFANNSHMFADLGQKLNENFELSLNYS